MSTLSQIIGTVVLGSFVTTVALTSFGFAIRFGWNSNLTPRAWSRPKAVLKNCVKGPFYGINWIDWAMRQQYIDLLAGVPGTGTRNDGWSGPTLKANLDAVIQIRFHVMQFKISIMATILMMFLLMPLYFTTDCDPMILGLQTCLNQQNLTDFERLTIANVPAYSFSPLLNGTTAIVVGGNTTVILRQRTNPLKKNRWIPNLTGRYVAPALVMLIITVYSCYLLWHEWMECLALRRVYYLESDYFMERIEELDYLKSNQDEEDLFQQSRPPFLPHPEMRETIPNVSLNSVLYQLPSHLKEYRTINKEGEGRSLLERQLDATVIFFDQCIPNQPGFTSSVVAVTIIPDAKLVAGAWMKWYACGKKFRRLRYIQHVLTKRKQMQADGIRGIHDYVDLGIRAPVVAAKATGRAVTHVADKVMGVTSPASGEEMTAKNTNVERDHQLDDEANDCCTNTDAVSTFESTGDNDPATGKGSSDEVHQEISTSVKEFGEKEEPVTGPNLSMKLESIDEDSVQDKEASNSNNSHNNWFGNVAAVFGLSQKPVVKEVVAKNVGEDSTLPKNKECQDLPEEQPISKSTRQSFADSTVYFEANETRDEPELTKLKKSDERFEYQNYDPEEFAQWIGFSEETTCDEILDTLGVEQLSVYSREMSQSASNPCVYGCNHETLALWSIDDLEEMLEDAWNAAREANAELLRVRAYIFRKENKIKLKVPSNKKIKGDAEIADGANRANRVLSSLQEEEEMSSSPDQIDLEDGLASNASTEIVGLRQRGVPSAHAKYRMAQNLVNQMNNVSSTVVKMEKKPERCSKSNFVCFAKENRKKVTHVLDHPSFAIVTFTSRQAAIAARQCLADGKGTDRWKQVDAIPVPPLADAPPRNIFFCRGCCRPVTLTINPKERKTRQIFVWAFYIFFCCLYTVPLALTSAVLNPEHLAIAFPDAAVWKNSNGAFYRLFAGISSGMLYSLFFSILPQIFKFLAFMLGSASTVPKGEDNALLFYWYFMLVTAFTGSTLATMLLEGLFDGNFHDQFVAGLSSIARTIPTSQAPVWLNWMITRTFITLPVNYLFQFMTFFYGCIKFKWLNRVMRGGGPGGPPPYRINVDSGVVFMCITSLAPTAPIIAPFATLYYMIFIPMLRWLHIFVYRPKYDAGGSRFPIYHEIIISSLILGQVLVAACILLKQAIISGFFIFAMVFPTYYFSRLAKEQFERSYNDAGLLQTSQLDGWGIAKTLDGREKYRRWLVDCHKAAYVPICLSGGEDFLTSQPAVTVPTYRDIAKLEEEADEGFLNTEQGAEISSKRPSAKPSLQRWKQESAGFAQVTSQKGAVFKRYLES